jgi:acetyl-CoA acetyltransferase family protein
MPNAVIVDACRTPIGTWGGKLSAVRADDLAALCLRGLIARTHLDPGDVEEVILGCANQAGEDNRNVARMALLLAGFPHRVAGITVNRLCASGLDAIIQAARAIRAGEGDCYIAGGVESMTRAPYVMAKPDSAFSRTPQVWDTTIGWRFPNPEMERRFPLESMGQTAENIAAERPAINRQRQDHFALESHRRAVSATNAGRFKAEIVPVPLPQKRGDPIVVEVDEHPRMALGHDGHYALTTSLDELSKLKSAFRDGGSVTAGNASGINDGAAAVLITSEERARALGRFQEAGVRGRTGHRTGAGGAAERDGGDVVLERLAAREGHQLGLGVDPGDAVLDEARPRRARERDQVEGELLEPVAAFDEARHHAGVELGGVGRDEGDVVGHDLPLGQGLEHEELRMPAPDQQQPLA